MKKKLLIPVLAIAVMLICLAGCGGPTLESYYDDNPSESEEILKAMSMSTEFLTMDADFDGNTIILTGTLNEEYGEEEIAEMKAAYEKSVDGIGSALGEFKKFVAEKAEVDSSDVSIKLIYRNGDETEFWSHTFEE